MRMLMSVERVVVVWWTVKVVKDAPGFGFALRYCINLKMHGL